MNAFHESQLEHSMPKVVNRAMCAFAFAVLAHPISGCRSRRALLDSVTSGEHSTQKTASNAGDAASADPSSITEEQWAEAMSKI
jgi:hypothetical protein